MVQLVSPLDGAIEAIPASLGLSAPAYYDRHVTDDGKACPVIESGSG